MIDKLVGETMKILSMKYNKASFCFEVECIMPGHTIPNIYQFGKQFFPQHATVPLLDEQVQVGEIVQIWLKEEELLKSEGWTEVTKHTLKSPDSPFSIGKGKKPYLGGAHKGIVCLDENFKAFVSVKQYRFSPKEIKCVLRLDDIFNGKNATIVVQDGSWSYDADKRILATAKGFKFGQDDINNMIDVLRRARLV